MDNTSAAHPARGSVLDPFPLGKRKDAAMTQRDDRGVGGSTRIEIGNHEAVSVQIAIGTAIQCVDGMIWLTQENDTRDYCVPAGTTFCADRAGRAVLTAMDGGAVAVLHFADAFASGRVPGTVQVDSFAQLTRAARKARRDALADIAKRLLAWLSSRLQRMHPAPERPPHGSAPVCKGNTVLAWRTLDMSRQ